MYESKALRIIADEMERDGSDFRTDEHVIEALSLRECANTLDRMADEIEKLRAALLCFKAMMADDRYDVGEVVEQFSQIARAALEVK